MPLERKHRWQRDRGTEESIEFVNSVSNIYGKLFLLNAVNRLIFFWLMQSECLDQIRVVKHMFCIILCVCTFLAHSRFLSLSFHRRVSVISFRF